MTDRDPPGGGRKFPCGCSALKSSSAHGQNRPPQVCSRARNRSAGPNTEDPGSSDRAGPPEPAHTHIYEIMSLHTTTPDCRSQRAPQGTTGSAHGTHSTQSLLQRPAARQPQYPAKPQSRHESRGGAAPAGSGGGVAVATETPRDKYLHSLLSRTPLERCPSPLLA